MRLNSKTTLGEKENLQDVRSRGRRRRRQFDDSKDAPISAPRSRRSPTNSPGSAPPGLFETLTQTFVQNDAGIFNAHHYRHSPSMSTFVFECDAATWARAGFERMDEAATLAYCERVFADALQGHRLVSNKSIWRNFPNVRNARWSRGQHGADRRRAAHRAFLDRLGHAPGDGGCDCAGEMRCPNTRTTFPRALAAFEAARRPIVEKLVAAADASADWYEHFPEHMQLAPRDFAWSYIQRSGRIDPGKTAQDRAEVRRRLSARDALSGLEPDVRGCLVEVHADRVLALRYGVQLARPAGGAASRCRGRSGADSPRSGR